MKGQETLSSRRDGGIGGGRSLCLYRKGVEPRRGQLAITPDAGKSQRNRQGSEQTSSPASGIFRKYEIFGCPVRRVGGGGSPEGLVAWMYASGSTLSWEWRNPPNWRERWPLYIQGCLQGSAVGAV